MVRQVPMALLNYPLAPELPDRTTITPKRLETAGKSKLPELTTITTTVGQIRMDGTRMDGTRTTGTKAGRVKAGRVKAGQSQNGQSRNAQRPSGSRLAT